MELGTQELGTFMESRGYLGVVQVVCSGCTPLLRRTFLQNLTPADDPNFPLSITLMPKKPKPNSQKVVV